MCAWIARYLLQVLQVIRGVYFSVFKIYNSMDNDKTEIYIPFKINLYNGCFMYKHVVDTSRRLLWSRLRVTNSKLYEWEKDLPSFYKKEIRNVHRLGGYQTNFPNIRTIEKKSKIASWKFSSTKCTSFSPWYGAKRQTKICGHIFIQHFDCLFIYKIICNIRVYVYPGNTVTFERRYISMLGEWELNLLVAESEMKTLNLRWKL